MQLAGLDVDGGGDAGAGDFGEQADDVFPPGGVAGAAGPIAVVDHVVADAGFAGFLQAHGHVGAEQVGQAEDHGIHFEVKRIGLRRDEHARAGATHLVLVKEHLREPLVVEDVVHHLSFLLGEHVEVAVVIVANVVVVEPGHAAAFEFGSEVLVVPVDYQYLTVGVDGGHDDHDDVVEPSEHFRVGGGGDVVSELHRHLGGADFGGVNGAGDQDDGLAGGDEPLGCFFGQVVRVGQAPGDVAVLVQALLVVLGGQDDQQHVIAERGLAGQLHGDAVGGGTESAEVFDHFGIGSQVAVFTHLVAEETFGRGNFLRWGGESQEQSQRNAGKNESSSHKRASLSGTAELQNAEMLKGVL